MKRMVVALFLALAWSDTFQSRVEIMALLQSVNGEILSSSSSTRTLETWCGEHHMADDPKIVAERMRDVRKEPTAEQLQRLGVRDASEVRYRRVQLRCGAHVLSEADNWYVPSRLTAEMNHQLDTTDIAFGRAVQALHFHRQTLAAKLLWSPLPDGWEMTSPAAETGAVMAIPHDVLQHQAVLALPDGTPISEVIETYTRDVLAFPQPRPGK